MKQRQCFVVDQRAHRVEDINLLSARRCYVLADLASSNRRRIHDGSSSMVNSKEADDSRLPTAATEFKKQ